MSAIGSVDYAELLAETRPTVIHNDRQNQEYTARLESIVFRKKLTQAERELAELLAVLIEDYERKRYEISAASPTQVLQELMATHGLKQRDLAAVFGAESTVSAVLHGKREMTREHIRKLSVRFGVSPAVFF